MFSPASCGTYLNTCASTNTRWQLEITPRSSHRCCWLRSQLLREEKTHSLSHFFLRYTDGKIFSTGVSNMRVLRKIKSRLNPPFSCYGQKFAASVSPSSKSSTYVVDRREYLKLSMQQSVNRSSLDIAWHTRKDAEIISLHLTHKRSSHVSRDSQVSRIGTVSSTTAWTLKTHSCSFLSPGSRGTYCIARDNVCI